MANHNASRVLGLKSTTPGERILTPVETPFAVSEVSELRAQIELLQSDIDQLRADQKAHRADMEASLLYLVRLLNEQGYLQRIGELHSRIVNAENQAREVQEKFSRYTNLPPFRQLRALRRRLLGL